MRVPWSTWIVGRMFMLFSSAISDDREKSFDPLKDTFEPLLLLAELAATLNAPSIIDNNMLEPKRCIKWVSTSPPRPERPRESVPYEPILMLAPSGRISLFHMIKTRD